VPECRFEAARESNRRLFDYSKEGVPSKKKPFTLRIPKPVDRVRVAAVDQRADPGDRRSAKCQASGEISAPESRSTPSGTPNPHLAKFSIPEWSILGAYGILILVNFHTYSWC
jgi:hypothetical protein